MASASLARFSLVLSAGLALACSAQSTPPMPPTPAAAVAEPPASVGLDGRELDRRYRAALTEFDAGHYEVAARQFAELLLRLPVDASGDRLRHQLIQHIGWSLLGSYDVRGDATALDRGEAMLERYLTKHEQLLPAATAERETIYELLGEYQLRRDGEDPPDAHAELVELVGETLADFQGRRERAPKHSTDHKVRTIEVDTRGFARRDHPRVQAYFNDPRDLGPSLLDVHAVQLHPTRVLVRASVKRSRRAPGRAVNSRTRALVRSARLELERCYAEALSRGADTVERLELGLDWSARALSTVQVEDQAGLDDRATDCVRAALRRADAASTAEAAVAEALLELTFFVQSAGFIDPRSVSDFQSSPVPTPRGPELRSAPQPGG